MTHLGNLLTTIKNSQLRKKEFVKVPHTNLLEGVCKVMKEKGFINDYKIVEEKFKYLQVFIAYDKDGQPMINSTKLVSKPGVRRYMKAADIRPLLKGKGLRIISTPKGLMDGIDAKKINVGGELLCEVY